MSKELNTRERDQTLTLDTEQGCMGWYRNRLTDEAIIKTQNFSPPEHQFLAVLISEASNHEKNQTLEIRRDKPMNRD